MIKGEMSFEGMIDFAIGEEQNAYDFYMSLVSKVNDPIVKQAFEDFAKEELGHKMKLEAVKHGEFALSNDPVDIPQVDLSDMMVDIVPTPDMDYADALMLAMKKEKAAYRFYMHLAANVPGQDLKDLFIGLANEEANHKVRFEIEYDDWILKEN